MELTTALEVASIQSPKPMIATGGFTILSRLAIALQTHAGSQAPRSDGVEGDPQIN